LGIGIVFYMLKKPKESVLKKVPKGVGFCFTVSKEQLLKEGFSVNDFANDPLFKKLKSLIPQEAFQILNTVGINVLGEMSLFGTGESINLAWIGSNQESMIDTIEHYKWPTSKHLHYTQVKITNSLYLCYQWPVLVLCNTPDFQTKQFFDPEAKKLNRKEMIYVNTGNSLIYGFIIPEPDQIRRLMYIPLKGKAYVNVSKQDNQIQVDYMQPDLKLKGNLGVPTIQPTDYAFISWPLNVLNLNVLKLPPPLRDSLNKSISKPVSHIYGRVLDTFSTTEKIITYDMDEEYRLTQKILDIYKSYPGLWLKFMKSPADKTTRLPRITNMGLDILKLQFTELPDSYVIASEIKTYVPMPDYCVFANLELMQTDPFWQPITQTSLKKISFHAEPFEKGSKYVLSLAQ